MLRNAQKFLAYSITNQAIHFLNLVTDQELKDK